MKKIFACLVLFTTLLYGCDESSTNGVIQTDGSTNQIAVEVVEVIDGDTIKVKYNEDIEKVRYLLIDTPETNHHTLGKQPFGEEAKQRNKEILKSGNVTIEFDVGNRLDDYGRMLAYVYVDGESVQETLLEEGLARIAYIFPPNTRYLDKFEEASKVAKERSIGIWETDNYVTNRGFNNEVLTNNNAEEKSTNEQCNIKGNINRQGKKIYHIHSGKYYEQTNPEEWFCTEQDAIQAGFKKSGE
ncbi:MAG: thermonuclease family protein [Psychrobacillus psychrotolerans]|uniref:thermonuclease family protein n=1 Tax=Psychrobacillus psychrotolerans TaxID=126156 RepID=UPI003BB03C16